MSDAKDPASKSPPEPSDRAPEPPAEGAHATTPAVSEADALKAQVAALEDRLRRQQADFVNDSRRMQRQADERVKYAAQAVVEDLLGVADALHGAIEGLRDTEHERRVGEGLRMVERQLMEGLGKHGLTKLEALGKTFDPTVHEAILHMPSPGPEGLVLSIVRPGFLLHGRLVRPAHVVVSRKTASEGVASAPPEGRAGEGGDGEDGPESA